MQYSSDGFFHRRTIPWQYHYWLLTSFKPTAHKHRWFSWHKIITYYNMRFLIPLNCLNYFWKIKYLRRVLNLVRLQLKSTYVYAVNYCSRKSRFTNYNTYFDWVVSTTDVHAVLTVLCFTVYTVIIR